MNDEQLLRYSRHILLPEIDMSGQERLAASRVLIIGLGGLGSPVAMYLAAAGIGHLALSDYDKVELSNLQRQIIHNNESIGQTKAASACSTLAALNPSVRTVAIDRCLEGPELSNEVKKADVVVDCCDNFSTRFAVNEACVRQNTPLVSGAAVRFEGQVTVFLPARETSPCYRCLYQDAEELAETCSENGVLAPLVGVIGSIQATETIKVLLDLGETLCGKLLLFDAKRMEWRTLAFRRDPKCPVCSRNVRQ